MSKYIDEDRLKQAKAWKNVASDEEYKEVYYFMHPIWRAYTKDTGNSSIFSIARMLLFRGECTPLSHPIHRNILEIFNEEQSDD